MKRVLSIGAAALLAALWGSEAKADFAFTQGAGTTSVGFDGTHSGTGRCAPANTVCFGFVPMDASGAAFLTSGNPGSVTFPSSQPVTANLSQVGGTNVLTGGVAGSQGVGGLGASGAALVGNPVPVAGTDGSNARTLSTDATGALIVQPGNTANTIAWKVTGTGGTFPATQSGAWNVGQSGSWTVSLGAGAATIGSISNNTFGATQSGTWNINNIAGTVTLPTGAATSALQPTNAAQGSTTSGQTGHLTLAAVTTSPPAYTTGQTSPLSLDTAGNLRMNCVAGCTSSSSITGWAGSTIGVGTIQAFGATQGTIGNGLVPAMNAYVVNMTADPCNGTKLTADFESTSSGGQIVAGTASKITYVCSVDILTSTAANVSLIEGTGASVCTGGSPAGVYLNTSVTPANGAAFGANGGIAKGSGSATIAKTATLADNLCVAFTTTNAPQVNVHVAYVQQ